MSTLILGIATRFASAMGALMMFFFFVAAWDFAYGVVNQHLTYAVVTLGLGVIGAGNYYGLDAGIDQQEPGLRAAAIDANSAVCGHGRRLRRRPGGGRRKKQSRHRPQVVQWTTCFRDEDGCVGPLLSASR